MTDDTGTTPSADKDALIDDEDIAVGVPDDADLEDDTDHDDDTAGDEPEPVA
jgi:hypothetical protein